MQLNRFKILSYGVISLLWLTLITPLASANGVYQQPQEFLQQAFSQQVPKAKVLWLNGDTQKQIKKILGHKYPRLRLRYWQIKTTSVWILEEIGKEQPITVGIHIENNQIKRLKVLIYRETRGDEVRHRFFTKQFDNAILTEDVELNQTINGITGATLSVRALKKLSIMALWLASQLDLESTK